MKSITVLSSLALLALCSTSRLSAECSTGTSQADRDFWAVHGCNVNYFLFQYQAYDFRASNWGDRGFFDACNPNLEYPKSWSSSYLVDYGLIDNNNQSFHGTSDYTQLAYAADSNFHYGSHYEPNDDNGIFGSYTADPRHIDLACPLYDPA